MLKKMDLVLNMISLLSLGIATLSYTTNNLGDAACFVGLGIFARSWVRGWDKQ